MSMLPVAPEAKFAGRFARVRIVYNGPEHPGHVGAYNFVEGRTHDGRKFRILTIIDEASRECLAFIVARQLKREDVPAALADLFISRGPAAHIRSDNDLCWEAVAGTGQQILFSQVSSALMIFMIQMASIVKECALDHSKHRIRRPCRSWSSSLRRDAKRQAGMADLKPGKLSDGMPVKLAITITPDLQAALQS